MKQTVTFFSMLIAGIVVVSLTPWSSLAQAQDDVEAQNIEVARRILEDFTFTIPEATEFSDFQELYHDTYTQHGFNVDGTPETRTWGERLATNTLTHRLWPDYEGEILNVVATDDLVVVHTRVRGTLSQEMPGGAIILPGTDLVPVEEQGEWDFVHMFHFEEGKVAEEWWFWNTGWTSAVTISE